MLVLREGESEGLGVLSVENGERQENNSQDLVKDLWSMTRVRIRNKVSKAVPWFVEREYFPDSHRNWLAIGTKIGAFRVSAANIS